MDRATLTLHRLTSMGPYDEATEWDPPVNDPRVVSDLVVNDLDRMPWFYKSYSQSLPRVRLPPELPATAAATVDVLAGTATVAGADLSLAQLSRVLHLSAGVVRMTQRPYGAYLFRAAGSAGGRFPLEVCVAAPEGGLLPAGVYWYDPQDHSLVLVGPPSHGDSAVLVVTGVPCGRAGATASADTATSTPDCAAYWSPWPAWHTRPGPDPARAPVRACGR